MAFISKSRALRSVYPVPSLRIQSRGDKWYIDPEDRANWTVPYYTVFDGKFAMSKPPAQDDGVELRQKNPYPRLPYYSRSLRNPLIKYDRPWERRNWGQTMHVNEDQLQVWRGHWYRNNGRVSIVACWRNMVIIFAVFIGLFKLLDYLDRTYCLSLAAPKMYPFEQLYLEQGGRTDLPKDQRPYLNQIPLVHPASTIQVS